MDRRSVLTVGVIGGADGDGRSAGYYTTSVASGRDDYYTGKGEAPGRRFGAGAHTLGLAGEIDSDDFREIVMNARDPRSGRVLRTPVGDRPVRGVDMTFSGPMSVSLLFHLADEKTRAAARRAHDEAVEAALGYMERHACLVRRGKAGRGGKEVADGFVCGLFRHRTSRALDPDLHTHAVAANLARRSDGRYIALDATAIFHHAKTGGYLYQAELRGRLTDYLGVEWTPIRNGAADIAGVPRLVIEHFSKRRAQILETMDARHRRSPRSAQQAALLTRPDKPDADLAQLLDEWAAVASELGFGRAELQRVAGQSVERSHLSRQALGELARQLAGPTGLTRRVSTFDGRAAVQAFCEAHPSGANVERVEQLSERFLASEHVLSVERAPSARGPDAIRRRDGKLVVSATGARHTTPEMLQCEARLIDRALARRASGAGTVGRNTSPPPSPLDPALADEQAEMVRSLTSSGDGVEVVRAAAGTGKTYALDVAREAWQASHFRVVGVTLSARVACELRDTAGIDSTTVASVLIDLSRGWEFDARNVVVVDEAGMVGTRDLDRVAAACEQAGAKLVLVGDDHQLPEIDAGGAFRALAERLGSRELSQVRRQRHAADRAALADLRDGRSDEWLHSADERGQLIIERGQDAQYARLVSDWWLGREQLPAAEDAMMLAPTREAATALNERARAYMRHTGRLGDTEVEARGRAFARGDRIMCLRNAYDLGVLNGERGTVIAVEPGTAALRVQLDGREDAVALPWSYLESGDLAHGYAMTVHKTQGMTAERVYVLGSEEFYRELGYTALSRHREQCRFYLNAGEPVTAQLELEASGEQRDAVRERMARVLGRSRAKELALDRHETDRDLQRLPDEELVASSDRLEALLCSYPQEAHDADRQAAASPARPGSRPR